jgi:hypothetical protein
MFLGFVVDIEIDGPPFLLLLPIEMTISGLTDFGPSRVEGRTLGAAGRRGSVRYVFDPVGVMGLEGAREELLSEKTELLG